MAITDDVSKSGVDTNKHIDIGSSFELNLSFCDTLYLHLNDVGGSPIQFDAMFLMGLDERYLAMRSNILTREPLPLVKAAFVVIGYIVDRCFELVGYPAGYVKNNFNANTRPVSSNNAFASVDVYSNNVSSNNAATSKSPVSLSNEQLARLMSLLNDNVVSIANANMVERLKADNTVRVNQIVTIFLIKASIHLLDQIDIQLMQA
ncbi:hypothetical protein Tco_0966961 [Tanacetum coccineum]